MANIFRVIILITILTSLLFCQTNSFTNKEFIIPKTGQEYKEVEEYFKTKEKIPEKFREKESALRRFEVVFLISLPLVTYTSILTMYFYVWLESKDTHMSLSPSHWRYVAINAVTLSTYIAFNDYKKTHHKDKEKTVSIPILCARW